MSTVGFCTVAGAIMLASALQASIGFGIGMLAAPVVAIVDPGLIPGTLIMVAALVTLIVVVREREDIDLHGTGWALVGRVPGTIAGALLLAIGFRNCDEKSSEMSLQGLFELIRYIQWRHLLSHCLNPHAKLAEEP